LKTLKNVIVAIFMKIIIYLIIMTQF